MMITILKKERDLLQSSLIPVKSDCFDGESNALYNAMNDPKMRHLNITCAGYVEIQHLTLFQYLFIITNILSQHVIKLTQFDKL